MNKDIEKDFPKGIYYKKIINKLIKNSNGGCVKYLYKKSIEGIYDGLSHYCPEKIINEEFKISMRWVLADIFGDGCEVDEPEGLFDFLETK